MLFRSQGDSRETQAEIERMLGMSHDMFKHIVALNTYTEPFLSLKANDQRVMIEQLLGITQLSEKAETLKEQIKATKEGIQQEEFRIKAVQDANKRMHEQVENLIHRQGLWQKKKDEDLVKLQQAYDELDKIDIEAELLAHQLRTEWSTKVFKRAEIQKHIAANERDETRETKIVDRLRAEIASLEDHKCHACGQELHDNSHEELLAAKKKEMQEAALNALAANTQYLENTKLLEELGVIGDRPDTFYDREADAFEHRSSMSHVLSQLLARQEEADPYADQIVEMQQQAEQDIDYTDRKSTRLNSSH